jgi:hypothetical protein
VFRCFRNGFSEIDVQSVVMQQTQKNPLDFEIVESIESPHHSLIHVSDWSRKKKESSGAFSKHFQPAFPMA